MQKQGQREEGRKNGVGRQNSCGNERRGKKSSVSMAAMVTLLPESRKKCGGEMVMVAGHPAVRSHHC